MDGFIFTILLFFVFLILMVFLIFSLKGKPAMYLTAITLHGLSDWFWMQILILCPQAF